jgi:hypothetical protein
MNQKSVPSTESVVALGKVNASATSSVASSVERFESKFIEEIVTQDLIVSLNSLPLPQPEISSGFGTQAAKNSKMKTINLNVISH